MSTNSRAIIKGALRSIGKIGERLPKPQLQDKMGALKRKADKLDVKGILTYNPTQPTVSRLMGKYVVSPEGQWFPKKEESAMSQQGVFMAKQLRGEQLTPEESEENRRLTVQIGTEIGKGAGLAAPRAVDPSMYVNAEAIEAVNAGKEIPSKIGDFRVKWKATDGWRGYYDATPVKGSGWEKFDSDWVFYHLIVSSIKFIKLYAIIVCSATPGCPGEFLYGTK